MAVDVQGKTFEVGQKVAKAYTFFGGSSAAVEIVYVTKVDGDRVFLNNSPQSIKFPERLCIIGMVDILHC